MEEVGGEHGRGLTVQKLPPTLTCSRFNAVTAPAA
jgi:hypothetical protein